MLHKKSIMLGLLLCSFALETAFAQKSKPTPPPPPGTILFSDNAGGQWGMKADGTGKELAFAGQFLAKPVPSAQLYGTQPVRDRWWLTLDEVQVEGATHQVAEVFACRLDNAGNLQRVQLTSLYPHVTLLSDHSNPGFHSHLCWSNDGTDSFVSFRGRSYGAQQTAETSMDASDDLIHIFRLNFSGIDIQACFDQGIDPKFNINDFAGGAIESVLETAFDFSEWNLAYHHWSPDGTRLVYSTTWDTWVADCSMGTATHGDGNTWQIWSESRFVRWSPNGGRIALSHDGSVWTINPNGTGATLVLGATRSDRYAVPIWSPDSGQLAINHSRIKGLDSQYFISRVPATGGTVTMLTKDMDPALEKRPMGWPLNDISVP